MANLLDTPGLLRRTWRHHRASGAPLADFVLTSRWKNGPSVQAEGPFMISVTQYTPNYLTDIRDIWRMSEDLGDQLAQIDGAAGVMTYIQPARRRLGSISIWADDRGLTKFIVLPDHVDTMNKYRSRGLPIRSAKWWTDEYRIGSALTRGLHLLDSNRQRRIVGPRSQPGTV
ncbi:hypothetical protein ACFQZZ_18305 [Nocardia sp. GCM10030253]|uniref:hypothetical protein n=1 Tax=Nocardia sp. GCM10030253 TaxID=3273404 RepID=UPI0036327D8F